MAEIFLAQSHGPQGFEKQVVIKRIRSALADDPSFIQMFIAEARVASKLNHANVVHIFDFDQHQDSYYLAMEYVRGKSLAEVHRRSRTVGRPFPPVLAAQIALEVARGLAYAHRLTEHGQPLGLVHRDVTPHNVLLSYDGAVKLTDFGIAKASNRASTAGMLKGKFAYMAPEQARGDPVDARTDLFALGITLWELLTGSRLFDGESDLGVLRAVQEREIVAPATLNRAVDPLLSDVVMTALRRDPARRYQTAGELERKLLTYVIGATRAPEDTDVGLFVRTLFPDEARAEDDGEPLVPLQLVSGVGPTASRPPGATRSAGGRGTAPEPRMLQQTVPSSGLPPSAEDEAFAPTRTPTSSRTPRRASAATSPGGQSAITHAPPDEASVLAAQIGGGRRRLALLVAAVAVVAGVAGIAFFASRNEARPADAPGGSPVGAPVSAGVVAAPAAGTQEPRAPEPPVRRKPDEPPRPAPAPGYLQVKVQPWGKLFIDGKFQGDVEGLSRRISLPAGSHTVRLINGKKARTWTVDIEPGKSDVRQHSFIEE
jgi:eukaryotic-like serine/threonine-protein kinase